MRNILSPVLITLLLALAPAARADTKIGVVDFQRAGNECDEGKAAGAALNKEKEEKLKVFKAKQTEFDALRADFEKQQAVLSDAVKQQKAGELQKKAEELQTLYMQVNQDLAQRDAEVTQGVSDRLNVVVREVAEKEGLQLILNKAAAVYTADALDLTNEVIRRYNAKFPYKAGATPATGTDPKAKPKPKAGGK